MTKILGGDSKEPNQQNKQKIGIERRTDFFLRCDRGAVKPILGYLRGTTTYGLHITCSSSFDLHGFIDADWAGSTDD